MPPRPSSETTAGPGSSARAENAATPAGSDVPLAPLSRAGSSQGSWARATRPATAAVVRRPPGRRGRGEDEGGPARQHRRGRRQGAEREPRREPGGQAGASSAAHRQNDPPEDGVAEHERPLAEAEPLDDERVPHREGAGEGPRRPAQRTGHAVGPHPREEQRTDHGHPADDRAVDGEGEHADDGVEGGGPRGRGAEAEGLGPQGQPRREDEVAGERVSAAGEQRPGEDERPAGRPRGRGGPRGGAAAARPPRWGPPSRPPYAGPVRSTP